MDKSFLAIPIIIFSLSILNAEVNKTEAVINKLSYNEYLNIIKEKLPELKKSKIKLLQSKNRIDQADAINDFNLNGNLMYSKSKPYSQGGSSLEIDSTKAYTASIGVDKAFSLSGTRVSATMDYSNSSLDGTSTMTNPQTSISQSYNQPSIGITITQPVLYNFLGKLDKYTAKNAKMQYEIDLIRNRISDRSIIKYYRKLYFQWYQLNEMTSLLKKTIKNTKKLEAQVKRKAAKGLADNDDIQKMKSSVFKYQVQLHQYEKMLSSITGELSILFDSAKYKPQRKEFVKLFQQSIDESFKPVDFKETDNCKTLNLTIKNLEYTLDVNENKLLPQLNIIGSVTQKGNEDSFSDSISGMKDTDYYVGLALSYPIGNTNGNARVKEAELKIKELGEEYKETLNSYNKNIIFIISSMNGNRKIYEVRQANLKAMNSQYKTELSKYRQARLNLTYLIQTESGIYAEKLNILQLQADMIAMMFDYEDMTK